MRKKISFLQVILLLILAISCSYDNLEEFYDEIICDTTDVSFSETVFPIVERNCLGCHFNGNQTGVDLTDYEKIRELTDQGKFLGNIQQAPGFTPMPPNIKLDECTISKITNWVSDGALNN